MGITIVQKSDLSRPKQNPKVALVLAGGAISGGAFKVGGLVALNSFLQNRKITEFDMYLGISAGAFLAAPISAGIAPAELLASIRGESDVIDQFRPLDFYYPNFSEFVGKPAKLCKDIASFLPQATARTWRFTRRYRSEVRRLARTLTRTPSYANLERLLEPLVSDIASALPIPTAGHYVPTGLCDNRRIERFIRRNLAKNGVPNDFRLLHMDRGNTLYICATNLDTAEGVVFGHDEDTSVTISEAVQASTAIPGFYKPTRLNGMDYVDAAVRKTANISTVVRRGADLVIAYNPFRPFVNWTAREMTDAAPRLSDGGFVTILNQALRTLLHTRLHIGIEKLRLDKKFEGDVILIEPEENDLKFFNMNPLNFWDRHEAALQGFRSVRASLERAYPKLVRILRAYSIETDLDSLRESALTLGITPEERNQRRQAARARAFDQSRSRLRVVK